MLRTILVGLDGSEHSDSALDLAIRWAKRSDILVVGMGCVDEPGIHGVEEVLVGQVYFDELNASLLAGLRSRVEGALSRGAQRCAKAGVSFMPLQDVGTPHAQFLEEAQRFDLIVLGRQTHFQFGWEEEPDATLSKVLGGSPRPVVVASDEPVDGDTVIVAYDGSLQAARALYAFEASGLGRGVEITVVTIVGENTDSTRCVDRAVEFLKLHGLDAHPHPVDADHPPAEVLLEMIRLSDPGLVVMGAYGQPVLREFFLGSTTRTMLEKSMVPLFLYH